MSLPFFYIPHYNDGQTEFLLDEDNSRHIVQVLRMKPGETLYLTDGNGQLLTVAILEDHKKKCRVQVVSATRYPRPEKEVVVAISLLKNTARFEWFLEKAMEIGVSGVIPLLCERTEKAHFRQDRMQNILVSALLQSRQTWLPHLSGPTAFDTLLEKNVIPVNTAGGLRRYIAHCLEEQRLSLAEEVRASSAMCADPIRITADPDAIIRDAITPNAAITAPASPQTPLTGTPLPEPPTPDTSSPQPTPVLILIGPEGDFTKEEITRALARGYKPVTLGETRLRTETAGIVAATLLCID
ncbi:MAG: RsmE family RNA methyltransferase [Puia sp.]|nr:RsmE family RNA methyltransferase [Puia sp.]